MNLESFPTDLQSQARIEIEFDPHIKAGRALCPDDIDRAIALAKKLKSSGDLTDDEIEQNLSLSATIFQHAAANLINQANSALGGNSPTLVKAAIAANSEARNAMEQLQQTRNRRKKKESARKNLKQSKKSMNSPKVQDILRAV